ncbi:pyridoxal 5'-phosphate synthase glutaminase subunit PdxT [Ornithinimicrobium cryptoxanthini]|uniref:Pyridoxal 5'-phosphate synthase subunit PdxT n=1 Tax=Ornithinimicrobium cryptoxanthini TaxID=2934161 RepID=A0ABY4YMV1_9MICO|nr:pyridoxal 5'-phosphate synthase glutaminase subunit PdxT [Ornithinimicrobium cryptoxanthini]USQ77871.1 pyridoxal 5'-phosphate synthase glutaminase subunit PdxT [Ornithinimicrobium cryptoxanthini]
MTRHTSAPLIGVLAVQGDVVEHVRALTLAGAQAVPVRRPAELATVDGLVIPGGESSTIDRLIRIFELDAPLRARLADGMPAFGSCAGMILLSGQILDGHRDQRCLGALDISTRRNAFGRQVDSFEVDLPVTGLAEPFRAVFIRAPWVERVGEDVEVLARVEREGSEHVVAVRQGRVLATSFHPEMTDDPRIHALFVEMVREAGSIDSRANTRATARATSKDD